MNDLTPSARTPFATPLAAGDVLADRYRIEGILGQGASGTVYAAIDQPRNSPVALKIIHRHLVADQQMRSRFFREMKILERLSGEQLVALLGCGEHDEALFMVQERALGKSLDLLLSMEGEQPIDRCLGIVLQVCDALTAAHEADVIHRDLKPGNVMVETGQLGDRIKVLDFGMAKILGVDGVASTVLTERNVVFGTPEYMSPEQARGDELDARCDIYGVGIMLYELLTGRVPFRGHTAVGLMTAHLTHVPPSPQSQAPERGIPPALAALVLHALAKERDGRYPSAKALKRAIEHALDHPEDIDGVRPERFGARGGTPEPAAPLVPRGSEKPLARMASARVVLLIALLACAVGIGLGIWLSLRG